MNGSGMRGFSSTSSALYIWSGIWWLAWSWVSICVALRGHPISHSLHGRAAIHQLSAVVAHIALLLTMKARTVQPIYMFVAMHVAWDLCMDVLFLDVEFMSVPFYCFCFTVIYVVFGGSRCQCFVNRELVETISGVCEILPGGHPILCGWCIPVVIWGSWRTSILSLHHQLSLFGACICVFSCWRVLFLALVPSSSSLWLCWPPSLAISHSDDSPLLTGLPLCHFWHLFFLVIFHFDRFLAINGASKV